jgi:hypothetical protein
VIIPDTVIKELARLDDQYLREGTVIHDQDQPRYRVFVPKQLVVQLIQKLTPTVGAGNPKEMDVELTLNDLVFVGTPVVYGPRIHIGTPASPAPAAGQGANPASQPAAQPKQ